MNSIGKRGPDFFIIGAMKCATSTLHDQLAQLPGFGMSDPKEPNYFSNDEEFNRGPDWYYSIFPKGSYQLLGESSTHYTKFPTYPMTLNRMEDFGVDGKAKFIYVIRQPIQRLVSHYIHEWSQGNIHCDIDTALDRHPELIDYSRYSYQLDQFLEVFGPEQFLIVFFEGLRDKPDETLKLVCDFLEYSGVATWDHSMGAKNVSSERIRKFPLYDLIVESKVMTALRRFLIPKHFRNFVKNRLTMKERPKISAAKLEQLYNVFQHDLDCLGTMLNCELTVDNFGTQGSAIIGAGIKTYNKTKLPNDGVST